MNIKQLLMLTAVAITLSGPAMAQAAPSDTGAAATQTTTDDTAAPKTPTAGSETQRDLNQQNRIEQGLQSGQLNTKEAAGLEKGEARVDHVEAKDMKDGTLSPAEKARIQHLQNKESTGIYNQKHDAQTGNPNSASSQRMQGDVQRDANQEQRIHNGVANGTLTNHETGALERRQGRNDRVQARAGANGHVGKWEQRRAQRTENGSSRGVWRKKHNLRNRRGATTTP
jgi:hypothetical protein